MQKQTTIESKVLREFSSLDGPLCAKPSGEKNSREQNAAPSLRCSARSARQTVKMLVVGVATALLAGFFTGHLPTLVSAQFPSQRSGVEQQDFEQRGFEQQNFEKRGWERQQSPPGTSARIHVLPETPRVWPDAQPAANSLRPSPTRPLVNESLNVDRVDIRREGFFDDRRSAADGSPINESLSPASPLARSPSPDSRSPALPAAPQTSSAASLQSLLQNEAPPQVRQTQAAIYASPGEDQYSNQPTPQPYPTEPGDPQSTLSLPGFPSAGQGFPNAERDHAAGSAQPLLESSHSPLAVRPVSNAYAATADSVTEKLDPLDERLPGPRGGGKANATSSLPSLPGGGSRLMQTGIALAIVLALLFAMVWLMKRATPKSMQALPLETIEVLGNAPLTAKQHLRLIRLGNRLLLLSVSESTSHTLAEVTEVSEVQRLLALCQSKSSASSTQAFHSILRESERDKAIGFLGSQQDRLANATGPRSGQSRSGQSQAAGQAGAAGPAGAGRPAVRPVSQHFFEA